MSLDRLQHVFVVALGVPADTDFESLQANNVEEWDSIGRMQLVLELERAFNIALSPDDVFGLDSFKGAREILARHGVEISA